MGWDEEKLYDLLEVLGDIYNLEYEIKNCIRGSYTGCHTYEELSKHIERLAHRLEDEAEHVSYMEDDEEEEEEDY